MSPREMLASQMSKSELSNPLGYSAKGWARSYLRRLRTDYMRWRHGFGPAELLRGLRKLDVHFGDAILVHSGMDGFSGWKGTIPEIVNVLEEAVGPEGNLLMPTLSISGTAVSYAKSGAVFDPGSTPSRAGLLSEVFRRSVGVARSLHPTHSVAVWGANQGWWIENHHLAASPCGLGTPFYRLWERGGKIVLAGVDISTLTFFHCAEELLEPTMQISPFTSERYVMVCRVDGLVIETAPMRLYAPEISRRRCLPILEIELKRRGLWRESRIGSLRVSVLAAVEVLDTLKDMAAHGIFCYNQ